jgi:hypothetical protein
MEQQSWLAMRGFVDIVLGYGLLSRLWFQTDLGGVGQRARVVQIVVATLLLLILQGLGVWSWAEIRAAGQLLPVIWPVILLLLYGGYRIRRLQHQIAALEFEIDWRRDYQNFIHENYPTLPPPLPPDVAPSLPPSPPTLTTLTADGPDHPCPRTNTIADLKINTTAPAIADPTIANPPAAAEAHPFQTPR